MQLEGVDDLIGITGCFWLAILDSTIASSGRDYGVMKVMKIMNVACFILGPSSFGASSHLQ